MSLTQIIFVPVGFLLILLAVPLLQRKVKPNGTYGLRVAATLRNESVWYDANAIHGRDILILGLIILVLAFAAPHSSYFKELGATLLCAGTLFVGAVFCAVIGWCRAECLLAQYENR